MAVRKPLALTVIVALGVLAGTACRVAEGIKSWEPVAAENSEETSSTRPLTATSAPTFSLSRSPALTPAPTWTLSPRPPMPTSTPTLSPEPLVPTPGKETSPGPSPTGAVPRAIPLPTAPPQGRERFGVGVPRVAGPITDYPVERLGVGWYLNWWVEIAPPRPGGVAFWQMVRVSQDEYQPDAATIRTAAVSNPGSVWLIGNEPDVPWQDNTSPERYAELYHELYQFLKAADPACQIAIGGVSQPTPLRMAYLDRVLSAYESQYGGPMPVDMWNVHNFILREERESWGVSIPPGMDAAAGTLYEVKDHDDLAAFKNQIVTFRRWMAERGQRDRPLVVSEYGVLMPSDYGFDEARVQAFMYATFDYLLTATDEKVGYPRDGNRLVQWWAWYSLADTIYPTGNLFYAGTRAVTPLGSAFARYAPPQGTGGQ
jgi:hypothetical protein